MPRKTIFLVLLAIIALSLGACTRSASQAPVDAPTQDPIESIFSTVATQTALAAGAKSAGGGSSTDDAPQPSAMPTDIPTNTPESTATNTPAPTSESNAIPATYELHLGEWPYCLARRFNIDPDAIIAANNITASTELSVGTVLTIPADAASFGDQRALRSHPTSYTASGNDSFFSIACEFGDLWPEHIAEANGKKLKYQPSAGELLQIP